MKINEKKIPLLAAFLFPLLLVLLICIARGIYPFGDQCMLHIDMYHQYCPFFTELMHKLKSGGSLFYSWNIGLGADFISLYAYYLASPMNWLLVFCPQEFVIEFMTLLVVLKIALSGLFFAFYLKEHFGKNDLSISFFGTAYALSGFMAAYAWNIMWLDCVMLAPLILLGLERLVREKKSALYYVTLSLAILSNYYIAIMICIFLVFWFLFTWLENRTAGWRAWLRFAGYSLLAGGTGAVLIFPEAMILGRSGSQDLSFPETTEWYFSLLKEVARHSVLTEPYMGNDHWPNLYCGIFTVLLVGLYLLNREISWKKKLPKIAFVLFFLISFANNQLDFIWHGFHFPDALPGRQTFLYMLLLLLLAYEAFLHLRGNGLLDVIASGAAAALLFAASYRVSDETLLGENVQSATLFFLGCYVVLLVVYFYAQECVGGQVIRRFSAAQVKSAMLAAGALVMLAELLVNFHVTGLGTTGREDYVKDLKDYRYVLQQGEAQAAAEGLLFYRTEELERKTKNDAALSGYRSGTQFSSLMNLDVSHFYQAVGMEGGKNFYCANGATPLFSAMLSMKYVLADNGREENPFRRMAAQSGETYLYENKYVLPFGFLMDESVIAEWDYKNGGDIGAQNELAYLLGAAEPMLTEIPSESYAGESVIAVDQDGAIFAVYEKTSVNNLTEEISDGRTKSFTKVSHGYTLDLGYCTAGSEIKIKNTKNEQVQITAYRLNPAAFQTAFDTLNQQTMTMTSFSDTKVTGTVDVKRAGRLIFSVADEPGWTLFVDGEETESEPFGEAFLSTHLTEGMHEIELRYRTPGFAAGASVSIACVGIFLLVIWVKKKKIKKAA